MGQTIKEKWFLIRNDLEFFYSMGTFWGKVMLLLNYVFADSMFIPSTNFSQSLYILLFVWLVIMIMIMMS